MNRLSYYGTAILFALFFFACGKKSDPFLPVQIAPKPIKKFQAIARPESVVLLWKAPRKNTNDSPLLDLAGFKVFRAEVSFEKACLKCPKNFIQVFDYDYRGPRGEVPGKEWSVYYDRALRHKNLYTYKIHCYTENDILGLSSKFLNVYYDVPPAPPSGVIVKRKYRVVIVEWAPSTLLEDGTPVEGIEGFNVYRTMKRGEYEQFPINKEIIKDSVFEDIPEKDDIVYFYTLRTVRKVKDTLIESAPSEEIAVSYMDITPVGVPQGLTAIPTKRGMLLKWMPKTEKDFAGFNLYRKLPHEESFIRLNEELIKYNSWIDKTAKIRKRYIYGVTSVDRSVKGNESALSETVEVLYILK